MTSPAPDGRYPYVSPARLAELHALGLRDRPGRPGPADPEPCLDGAIGNAHSAEFYMEGARHYTAGLGFAAHLLLYLANRHCFTDGNKRIAWIAAMDVLLLQGLTVVASQDEAYDLVLSVVEHRITTGVAIAQWMAPRLAAVTGQ